MGNNGQRCSISMGDRFCFVAYRLRAFEKYQQIKPICVIATLIFKFVCVWGPSVGANWERSMSSSVNCDRLIEMATGIIRKTNFRTFVYRLYQNRKECFGVTWKITSALVTFPWEELSLVTFPFLSLLHTPLSSCFVGLVWVIIYLR